MLIVFLSIIKYFCMVEIYCSPWWVVLLTKVSYTAFNGAQYCLPWWVVKSDHRKWVNETFQTIR